jgi:hypothetical protein
MNDEVYMTDTDGQDSICYSDWPEDFTGLALASGIRYVVKDGGIVYASGHWRWDKKIYLAQEAFEVLEQMNGFANAESYLSVYYWVCDWCGEGTVGQRPDCPSCGAPKAARYGTGFVGMFDGAELYVV